MLDAVRLGPDDDEAAVTAAQVRDVITRLITAGHWREGDPPIVVIFDAGYDVTRLSFLLADLPAELLGRLRSDRVMQLPAPPRQPGTMGRPCKHGRGTRAACPGDRDPKPVWLWWLRTGALPHDVDRLWQAFLRRFDLEHTFRLFKQVLGWPAPNSATRPPETAGPG